MKLKIISKNRKLNTLILIILISSAFSLLLTIVHAVPGGPTITILSNTTKNATAATKVNSTVNTTSSLYDTPGGFIFTTKLDSTQQNKRWKAYVGNVSGTLVLDDASDNRIYSWTLSTAITGEVYATRASGTVNWTGINCTWISNVGGNNTFNNSNASIVSNRSIEHNENLALNHSGVDDNITATFSVTNHSSMTVGSVVIGRNECFSTQTYQNGAAQAWADSDNSNFTEVLLYDGAFNTSDGNLIYATFLEQDNTGYDSAETYDFQMLLPENGLDTWQSSTAYYFYVELT